MAPWHVVCLVLFITRSWPCFLSRLQLLLYYQLSHDGLDLAINVVDAPVLPSAHPPHSARLPVAHLLHPAAQLTLKSSCSCPRGGLLRTSVCIMATSPDRVENKPARFFRPPLAAAAAAARTCPPSDSQETAGRTGESSARGLPEGARRRRARCLNESN